MKTYLSSQDSDAIAGILHQIVDEGVFVTLWQHFEEARPKWQARLQFTKGDGFTAEINSMYPDVHKTKVSRQVFFHTPDEKIIGKGILKSVGTDSFEVVSCKTLSIREDRDDIRKSIENDQLISVKFAAKSYRCKLIDVSSNGAAFKLPNKEVSKIEVDDTITVYMVLHKSLTCALKAKVRHFRPHDNENYKVGIEFIQTVTKNKMRKQLEQSSLEIIECLVENI